MMKIAINRTGRKITLREKERTVDAFEVIKSHGYERVSTLEIEGWNDISWEGIEFNRLFFKDGILFRFNNWLGEYPYREVEIEEIGQIMEVANDA